MKILTIKISTLIILIISICACSSLTVDGDQFENCQTRYLNCASSRLDQLWSLWDHWYAGQMNLSHEDFDSKQLDVVFDLFACDEVAQACRTHREPNFKAYLAAKHSFPETNWPLSSPEKEGLDTSKIQQAISEASSIPHFRSLLVATNGRLVVEEYYSRKNDPRPQHIQSVTKSITSILMGIAIDKGYIKSEKEVIKPFFPEYFSRPHDERKQHITIEQLLTMTSRLNFVDDPAYSKYRNSKSWQEPGSWKAYWRADNFLDRALSYDLVETDDEVADIYNTPACNLLTTVLKRSSNMTSKEFSDKYLFGPLGIKNYFWFHDSNYNYVGGHTIFIRPRDLATIGQMILDGGSYQGHQIISKKWLEKSFSPYVSRFVTTDDGEQVIDYGYLWYSGEYLGYQYKFGWGFGGQFLFLVPEANTLVVTTSFPDTDGHTHWEKSQRIIKRILLKVIEALPKVT